MPVEGCWWWQHSHAKWAQTLCHDLWHPDAEGLGTLSMTCSRAHCPGLDWLCAWATSGFSCGKWTLLHWSLSEPSICRNHRATEAMEEKQLDTRRLSRWGRLKFVSFCNSTKASALPVDLQLQNRQWAPWHWWGQTFSSDVLRVSWDCTWCLQKRERQAAVMGSRVTSKRIGRHLPMHRAWKLGRCVSAGGKDSGCYRNTAKPCLALDCYPAALPGWRVFQGIPKYRVNGTSKDHVKK